MIVKVLITSPKKSPKIQFHKFFLDRLTETIKSNRDYRPVASQIKIQTFPDTVTFSLGRLHVTLGRIWGHSASIYIWAELNKTSRDKLLYLQSAQTNNKPGGRNNTEINHSFADCVNKNCKQVNVNTAD